MKILNNNKKLTINKNNNNTELVIGEHLFSIDEPSLVTMDSFNKAPWISTYWFNTKPFVGEDVVIPFYCTNSNQDEYFYNKNVKLMLEVEKNGEITRKILNAGDNEVNIGSFDTIGEQHITLQITDLRNHYKSHKEVIQFLVIDDTYEITEEQTYIMTHEDLSTYGIDNTNNEDETIRINNSLNINKFLKEKREAGYRKVVLLNETGDDVYRIDPQGNTNNAVNIPSGLTLDGNNATIRQHVYYCPTGVGSSCIARTEGTCFDTHLLNLKVVGDYAEHDLGPRYDEDGNQINPGFEAEGFSGILFGGAFCSMKNVEMSYITSYAFGGAASKHASHATSDLRYGLINGTIDLKTGEVKESAETMITDFVDTKKFDGWSGWMNPKDAMDFKFLSVGVILGYSGLIGPTNLIYLVYYGENKNYIGYNKGLQFNLFERPDNTRYIRVICAISNTSQLPSTGQFRISALNYIANTNIEIEDFYVHNTRSCLTYPACNRARFKNCRFSRIAEEEEYKVTKLFFDNEDGSYNGFNFYFENCLNENKTALGGFNLVHGTNFVFKDNIGVDLRIWQCNGLFINYDCDVYLDQKNSGMVSRFLRCENINFTNNIKIVDTIDNKVQRAFKNCTFSAGINAASANFYMPQFIDCTFNTNSLSGNHLRSTYNFIDNKAIYFDGGNYKKCIFNAAKNGSVINRFKLTNIGYCDFNGKFMINSQNTEISNCKFEDLQLQATVTAESKEIIVIKNCDINFSTPLVKYSPFNYTTGTNSNVLFKDCNLNCINDSLSRIVDVYAKPQNSLLTFDNCNISNLPSSTYVIDGMDQYKENIKNCRIVFKNTPLNDDQNMIAGKYVDIDIKIEIL